MNPSLPAYLTAIVSFLTAVGMFLKLRSDQAKSRAEVAQILASANKTDAERQFVGISVVKDISEAAAVIVVPLTAENRDLRTRVDTLERKVETLEEENDKLTKSLHQERDRNERQQESFEIRHKELINQHRQEMADMEERLRKNNGYGKAAPETG
jgi:DNA anti-recombination protein RmuC